MRPGLARSQLFAVIGALAIGAASRAPATPVATAAPARGGHIDSLLAAADGATDPERAWALGDRALREAPDDLRTGNALRMQARSLGRVAEVTALLDSLSAAHPDLLNLRVHFALAHLDGLGQPGVDTSAAGVQVNRAARILTAVLDKKPTHWAALYGRVLCELVWPRQLRHARLAVPDIEHLQSYFEGAGASAGSIAVTHLFMGDVQVKRRRLPDAYEHYREGLVFDPASAALKERLLAERQELVDLVDSAYRLDAAPDTDLSRFLYGAMLDE